MEKNANYPEIEGLPAAKLDKITINAVTQDSRAITDVLQNKADYFDEPPTSDALREFQEKAPERYRERGHELDVLLLPQHAGEAVRRLAGRQAVSFAVDKRALSRLFGGLLEPSCNFLPPGMQGYTKIDPCPYGDPKAAPNIEKAKQLIQEAGVAGQSVTVYGNDEEQYTRQITEYLADVLEQIGLKPQLRIVNGDVYFQTIGNQKTKAAAGFANWFQDYPHPYNFMFLIDGASIQSTNNQNFGNVDDPEDQLHARRGQQEGASAEAAPEYAAVDKKLVDQCVRGALRQPRSCRSSCRTRWTSSPPCSTRCCRPCTRRSPSRASDVTGREGHDAASPLPLRRLIISSKARGVSCDHRSDHRLLIRRRDLVRGARLQ